MCIHSYLPHIEKAIEDAAHRHRQQAAVEKYGGNGEAVRRTKVVFKLEVVLKKCMYGYHVRHVVLFYSCVML